MNSSTLSVDSLDTRSIRKEAYSMLRNSQAIDKTLKWTMRTKLKTGPLAKVSLIIDPPISPGHTVNVSESVPSSPLGGQRSRVQTPTLERTASFTQAGLSKSQPLTTTATEPIDAPSSFVNIKGSTVPVDFVKDAMVDLFRKEGVTKRESPPPKGARSKLHFEMTDEGSFESQVLFNDSILTGESIMSSKPQHMRVTQAKQVTKLADPREEAYYKWKKMKAQRDERNASLERRRNREALVYNFTRVVHTTEQAEFHRAYRDQYMQYEYATRRQYQDRQDERRKLDERMQKQLAAKTKQQKHEAKFMRKMLRESANKARSSLWEEVSLTKMNNELSGTVSRSVSCLDVSSSSQVRIPDQLRNKMKNARSLPEFEAAKKSIQDYYQASMSERIAEYSRSRAEAISRAPSAETRLVFSPIRGSDLFQDSVASRELEEYELQRLYQERKRSAASSRRSGQTPKTPYEPTPLKPGTPSPPRPDTADFVLKEYFASSSVQQQLFDLENFSLHSAEDVSGFHELSLER